MSFYSDRGGASLVGSQVVGLLLARFVVRLEPLASATVDDLALAIGPTLQRYLTGDVGLRPRVTPTRGHSR